MTGCYIDYYAENTAERLVVMDALETAANLGHHRSGYAERMGLLLNLFLFSFSFSFLFICAFVAVFDIIFTSHANTNSTQYSERPRYHKHLLASPPMPKAKKPSKKPATKAPSATAREARAAKRGQQRDANQDNPVKKIISRGSNRKVGTLPAELSKVEPL